MKKNSIFPLFIIGFFLIYSNNYAFSQTEAKDTIALDSAIVLTNDSISNDSITKKISDQAIESKIKYEAKDSIKFLTKQNIIQLYGDVKIDYEKISLTAEYVEIDFNTKILFATGVEDSSGVTKGKPIFKEEANSFESTILRYNFETKKGYLTNIFTEESEAYLHGDEVLKMPDDVIYIKDGSFTTCPDHDPHFELKFKKAKLIPNNKIITGPVWFVIEDVPLPVGLPFGFFPNKSGRQNGILIPRYGESSNRGFFLEEGGYYLGLGKYADLAIKGDIYSRGSWAAKIASNYKKRYKFDGLLNVNYAVNKLGEPESSDFEVSKDFFVIWKHNQDPKAHPRHRFNADVRAGSRNYSKFNPTSASDYLSSTFSSSVTYSTRFGNNVNFSANVRHSQNKQTKTVDMNLPELTLSTNRLYPFRKKERSGKLRFYENINMSYVMNSKNTISTPDSLLFKDWKFQDFSNGMKHSIPISLSQKVLKHFNLTSSFSYTERWYLESLNRYWDDVTNTLITDTVRGAKSNRDFQLSTQLQTKLYGMFAFRKGPITAMRHIITPRASFTYRPDFGNPFWGYYGYYQKPGEEEPTHYSFFQNGIYGYSPYGKAGIVQLGVSNNLEIKVKTPKDSINPVKKITLIENLQASISNNIARDSLNWSKLSINGRTRLFNNVDISYIALLDPYIIDSTGRNLNKFEFDINDRLFRKTKNEWATSINWNIDKNTFTKKQNRNINNKTDNNQEENTNNINTPLPNVDYSIPWNLTLSYTLQHIQNFGDHIAEEQKLQLIQTLNFSGEVKLTPGWRISVMSGYDFINNDFSYTSINVYRDLHCWEIVFNWIPTGFRKSYNFTLRVKAPMLQDVKLERRSDWRDFY